MASIFIDPVNAPASQWINLHQVASLISAGVASGDQLQVTVLGGSIRYHFGDTEPAGNYGFKRNKEFITRDGLDCWIYAIGQNATLQVEHAP
jgi:hypothetical protein